MDKRTEKTTQHIPSVYMILSEFSNNSILYIIIYPRNVSTYTYNHQLILLANIWHSVVVWTPCHQTIIETNTDNNKTDQGLSLSLSLSMCGV